MRPTWAFGGRHRHTGDVAIGAASRRASQPAPGQSDQTPAGAGAETLVWEDHGRDLRTWTTATSRKRAEVAESKRRGEDAVDERLDETLDEDALHDDVLDDETLDDSDNGRVATKPKRADRADKAPPKPPAKSKIGERPNIFARIRNFIREVISELGKVIWPTRKELLTYTGVVIVFVAIIVTIVGLLDYGFAKAVLYVFGTGKGK
jgi:preprotein translocase subunit SecE